MVFRELTRWGGCSLRRNWSRNIGWLFVLLGIGSVSTLQAEDVAFCRSYFRFDADFDPKPRANDFSSLGFDASANMRAEGERTLNYWERNFKLESIGTFVSPEARTGLEYVIGDSVTSGFEAKKFWIDQSAVDRSASIDASAVFPLGLRDYFTESGLHPSTDPDVDVSRRFFWGPRSGGFILADNSWLPNISLTPGAVEKNSLNLDGGVAVGMEFDEHWGVELAADSMEPNVSINGRGTVGEYGMGAVIHYFRFHQPFGDGALRPIRYGWSRCCVRGI